MKTKHKEHDRNCLIGKGNLLVITNHTHNYIRHEAAMMAKNISYSVNLISDPKIYVGAR